MSTGVGRRVRIAFLGKKGAAPLEIPEEHATEMRRLIHDLSNALEIIVQTSYLLNMGEQDPSKKQWLEMMDGGVKQASNLSRELRTYVLQHGVETASKSGL
jgi:hypothetical protein